MSLQTDSIAFAEEDAHSAVSRRTSVEDEGALLRRAAGGDPEALRALCERLAPRVERAVRALFGGALAGAQAGERALHSLIELLASCPRDGGRESLEAWADRAAACSAVRLARAARGPELARDARAGELARAPSLPGDIISLARENARFDPRAARNFDRYLGLLSSASRELLVLRYVFGLSLGELAEVLGSPLSATKEGLLAARRELRGLARPRAREAGRALGAGAERWCALRDREAVGASLSAGELAELAELEARDPEVWAFAAQLRVLERYFEKTEPSDEREANARRMRVEQALAAVAPPPAQLATLASDADLDRAPEFDGSRWVRALAWLASAALTAASAAAVYLHRPLEQGVVGSADTALQQSTGPTVEALASARVAPPGGLRRDQVSLAAGERIAQGDAIEALARPGCVIVEPGAELCLASGSQVRVLSLLAHGPRFELARGRAVVRGVPSREPVRMTVVAAGSEASGASAIFAVERAGDAVQVRVLHGRSEVRVAGGPILEVSEGHAARPRGSDASEVTPLGAAAARRDEDLLPSPGAVRK